MTTLADRVIEFISANDPFGDQFCANDVKRIETAIIRSSLAPVCQSCKSPLAVKSIMGTAGLCEKCVPGGFARREGAAGIAVGNLCAFRSPSPAALDKTADPFGPGNQDYLSELAAGAIAESMPIVCAWGVHGAGRGDQYAVNLFREMGARLVCLGTTAAGHPKHPLYVKGDQPLAAYAVTSHNSPTEAL